MSDYSTDFFKTFLATAATAAKGFQGINAEMLSYGKGQLDSRIAAMNAMLAAESVKDALEIHSEFMKTSVESFIEESGKLGEMTTKVVSEVAGSLAKPMAA
ncbi:MAG TPA: phasin family protein [Parvibaculum sp.]